MTALHLQSGIQGRIEDAPSWSTRTYWACQLLGWGTYGVSYYLAVLVPFGVAGPKEAVADVAYCLAGLLSTHALRARIKRGGWSELPYARMLPRLAAGALASGVALAAALYGCLLAENQTSWNELRQRTAVVGTTAFFSSFLVVVWVAVYLGVHAVQRRRAVELDALRTKVAVREAKLRSLQQQLNPHFLFNCLNSLRSLIDEDQGRAREMVTRLAELLRASLRQDECITIPLEDELATIDAYLDLESVRLEERLRLRREIDPGVLSALVPPMLLQGLVENAIKHGIAPLPAGGELVLRLARRGDRLHIEVENSGTLSTTQRTGIGLANARERLRLLYGAQAAISLESPAPDLIRATVDLPFQQQEEPCAPSS